MSMLLCWTRPKPWYGAVQGKLCCLYHFKYFVCQLDEPVQLLIASADPPIAVACKGTRMEIACPALSHCLHTVATPEYAEDRT